MGTEKEKTTNKPKYGRAYWIQLGILTQSLGTGMTIG